MSFFVFVVGGVMSSLGKGIAAASIGALLQSRGFSIRMKKLDPYINVDPGTISPFKHGEVFVTEDGCEADLDLGHYERFTDVKCSAKDSLTTGKVYKKVLEKERRGDYLGSDIQVIPHVTNEIKDFILEGADEVDFTICEIGGTIGDIEGLPYIEALRQLVMDLGKEKVICVVLTYLPYIKVSEEIKTKPTQHSIKQLQCMGVQPDIILCRNERPLTESMKEKLSLFCAVKKENVIEAPDVNNVYFIPRIYCRNGIDKQICSHFKLANEDAESMAKKNVDEKWLPIENAILNRKDTVRLAVVGKYTQLKDAYLSLSQAIMHGGISNNAKVEIDWIDSEDNFSEIEKKLSKTSALIVPGGFSVRGVEGKIFAIKYARETKTPFLGICLGMQLAVIESCRNVANINAMSGEFGSDGEFVIDFMDSWSFGDMTEKRDQFGDKGGTMRLGNYPCKIAPDSLAFRVYGQEVISERHRHRYEVNLAKYERVFEKAGLVFSGTSLDNALPEIVERRDHPFFIGTQAHPEFKSRPFSPHPLFSSLIKAGLERSV